MELTFYLYDPKTFVYTKSVEAKTKPKNSSEWAPPECGPTEQAYFNGFGWVKNCLYTDLTPERIKALMQAVAAWKLRQKLARLNKGVPLQEVDTFAQQYTEAREFLMTTIRPVFLESLARARSEDLNEFAKKIIEKAEAYNTEKARILAAYQLETKGIEAAEEPKLTQELLQYPAAFV